MWSSPDRCPPASCLLSRNKRSRSASPAASWLRPPAARLIQSTSGASFSSGSSHLLLSSTQRGAAPPDNLGEFSFLVNFFFFFQVPSSPSQIFHRHPTIRRCCQTWLIVQKCPENGTFSPPSLCIRKTETQPFNCERRFWMLQERRKKWSAETKIEIECDFVFPLLEQVKKEKHIWIIFPRSHLHSSEHFFFPTWRVFQTGFVLGSTSVKVAEKGKRIHFPTSTLMYHVIDLSSTKRKMEARVRSVRSYFWGCFYFTTKWESIHSFLLWPLNIPVD